MSKATELTKIERDALRYRVLRRRIAEGGHLTLMYGSQCDFSTMTPSNLDDSCDRRTKLEDVADILIESTHPSLQLASSSSIEESCVQATREIATSLQRGIYQPLLPLDAQHLLACARLAEQMQQHEPVIEQATRVLKANTALMRHQQASLSNAMIHFMLALLASADQSIRIPISLVADFKIEDYVLEAKDDLDGSATTFTLKRKQEHQR